MTMVEPAWQLDEPAGGLAFKEFRGTMHRLRQSEPLAGGGDRGRVEDFGLNLNDVGHGQASIGKGFERL
jgi:hypothetical protein